MQTKGGPIMPRQTTTDLMALRSADKRRSKADPLIKKDGVGKLRLMVQAEGWAMVRRPGCAPFIMSFGDWLKLKE